ncbi:hypothetical protein RIF29_17015 [Crotalaria pallida]|uniref:Zinc-ribbon domain-containing protein n=1 Tax=Crotalaria pallida TaxID=3830 RepID=A0AAN9IEY7_CROPI
MSGESAPKPRLVLCPRCRQLLPEPPDVDVYQCGGCGTTLQAKKRKNRAVNSEPSTQQTDATTRNSLDLVSDNKQHSNGEQLVIPQENGSRERATSSSSGNGENLVIPQKNSLREKAMSSSGNGENLVIPQENSLREKATSSSSGECSLEGNGGRGQIVNGECHGEPLAISQETGLREKANSSSSGECSVDGNSGSGQTENGECNGGQLRWFNLSGEDLESETDIYKLLLIRRQRVPDNGCSNEPTRGEIEASSELKADHSVENANNSNLRLEGEEVSDGKMPLEGAEEESICAPDINNTNNEKSALVGVKPEVNITRDDLEGEEELKSGNLLPEGAAEQELISELDGEEVNNDKSAMVGASSVDVNGSNKAAEEINNGTLLLQGEEKELNARSSDREDIKNDELALEGANSDVDILGSASTARRSSSDDFISQKGSIAHVSPREVEEGKYGNRVSSPNEYQKQAQKKIHHSFDSVTSVDTCDTSTLINLSSELRGTLEELPKSPTTRSSRAYEGSISSNDWVDERYPSQQLDSFENSYTVANGVSEGRSRKGKGLANSMLYGDLDTQHQSYVVNGKHHLLKDNLGIQNEVPLPETTRHGHPHWMRTRREEFPSKIPFHRSGFQSGYESGSPSNQTHDDPYSSSSFLSPDFYEDPDQEKMKLLRMVYKLQDQLNRTRYANAETNGRLSTDISYKGNHVSTYHGHDLHEGRFYHGHDFPRCDHGINRHQRHNFSQPYVSEVASSAHNVDYSCVHCCPQERQCSAELPPRVLFQHEEICKSHPGCNCYSYPSSPQCFVPSKVLYGHETKSGDQRHRVLEVKNYLREKQKVTKRHYRPVAGGAPFVTCHKCLNLLQLPADFLIFKRVFHRLQCGSCSEVLKFSLQNRSHIVSYAPNAIVPSSCDLDDQKEAINSSNLHSADPISYSDDYGHSVSKSYSSEGDHVAMTPFHSLHDSENGNPSVCHGPSSSEPPIETDELAVDSSNITSEMAAPSPPKSSALHKLMGYSSPIQVIRGIQSFGEGREAILNGENDPNHNNSQQG